MPDRLLTLGQRPAARKLAGSLGLNLPPALERETGPWTDLPLDGREIVVGLAPGAELAPALATTLARAGSGPGVVGEPVEPFVTAGQGWSRPACALDREPAESERPHVLVVDATGIRDAAGLRALYDLCQPRVRALRSCGRVVVLARPFDLQDTIAAVAAQRAVEGFVRSLARELGRKGSTANLVVVNPGADDRIEGLLRFLLSPRSAYVTGQPIEVSRTVRAADPKWTRPLDGKVALVTGAARGIGAATARVLAREGARVIVLDRPGDDGSASGVAAEGGGVPLLVDLTEPEAAETVAAYVRDHHEKIDIVVHNAGVTRDRTLGRMSAEEWDTVIDVNLGAVLRLTEALDPILQSHGRVVYVSSIAGLAGNAGQTNYAASKAGIVGLVRGLAPRMAKRGIALNAVAPGFIETRMTAAIPLATREVARRLSNLSQGGLPHDVAEVVGFLASPGAAGLCGQVLRVCGGSFVGA